MTLLRPDYDKASCPWGWRKRISKCLPTLECETGETSGGVDGVLRSFFKREVRDAALEPPPGHNSLPVGKYGSFVFTDWHPDAAGADGGSDGDADADRSHAEAEARGTLMETAESMMFHDLYEHCIRPGHSPEEAKQAGIMRATTARSRADCLFNCRASEITLDDRTCLTAIKLKLLIPVLRRAAPCTCWAHRGKKKGIHSWSDAYGHHQISCPIGGFRIRAHDGVNKAIFSKLRDIGADCCIEPRYNADGTKIPKSQRRADGRIKVDPVARNGVAYWDAVLTNPTQGDMPALTIGGGPRACLRLAEARKQRDFPPGAAADVQPLCGGVPLLRRRHRRGSRAPLRRHLRPGGRPVRPPAARTTARAVRGCHRPDDGSVRRVP